MSIKVTIRKRISASFTLEVDFDTARFSETGCLGILGASGCGKSMTLKCIAGIEKPDEGIISIDDRVLYDSAGRINIRPQARRVGYLFQNYALFPKMTLLENITVALHGSRAERTRRAMVFIRQFELEGLEHRYPGLVSGGQQQRAALARMLAQQPSAVLFDEPFSALDSALREKMQVEMQKLLANGNGKLPPITNAIMVSHSRDEVYRLCRNLALLDNGRCFALDAAKNLFENPKTVRAALITGCKNISPVQILGHNEVFALDWGIKLQTAASTDGITHIGIRAHDLIPIENPENPEKNEMNFNILQESEDPFESILIFNNAEAQNNSEKKEIWRRYSKYLPLPKTNRLFFPPEKLLLLRE